ncbi:MAG: hypothetical protein QXS37_05155, partial [Candidatus Aenigmatarchaeota archaeon]
EDILQKYNNYDYWDDDLTRRLIHEALLYDLGYTSDDEDYEYVKERLETLVYYLLRHGKIKIEIED